MTPHDSTRCAACGHEERMHAFKALPRGARQCTQAVGRDGAWCECTVFAPTPALPTEGVGAVDHEKARLYAESFFPNSWSSLGSPSGAINLARAYLALREQIATLTNRLAAQSGWDENERIAALEAELAALRAPRADAGAVRDALMIVLREARAGTVELALALGTMGPSDMVSHDHEERIADALLAAVSRPTPPAAPVPSGVTEAMVDAGIDALDDVSGEKGLAMGRRERVRAIITAALAAAEQGGG